MFWISESATIIYAIANKIDETLPAIAVSTVLSIRVKGRGWLIILN
jgi:hypothetical protein